MRYMAGWITAEIYMLIHIEDMLAARGRRRPSILENLTTLRLNCGNMIPIASILKCIQMLSFIELRSAANTTIIIVLVCCLIKIIRTTRPLRYSIICLFHSTLLLLHNFVILWSIISLTSVRQRNSRLYFLNYSLLLSSIIKRFHTILWIILPISLLLWLSFCASILRRSISFFYRC